MIAEPGWDREAYARYKRGDRDEAARAANRDYQRDYWRRRRAGQTITRGTRTAPEPPPPAESPRLGGADTRDRAMVYNMARTSTGCRVVREAARRFAQRGLGGVRGNRGQREVRALVAMEDELQAALNAVRATRAVVAAERGES